MRRTPIAVAAALLMQGGCSALDVRDVKFGDAELIKRDSNMCWAEKPVANCVVWAPPDRRVMGFRFRLDFPLWSNP